MKANRCPRCHGCLALEAVSLDGRDEWVFLQRCMNCGWRGYENRFIAAELQTSPKAVERHRGNLLEKWG